MDLRALPHEPGVYLMRDHTGQILYVGKALDLFKRVSSYFMDRAQHTIKINALVASVNHVDYIPAASEREALIIEQGLIRRLQPMFNTMWRDDKSYPYLKLTWAEDFPRMFLTRRMVKDGSHYFGPYPNAGQVRRLMRYLWRNRFFPLRPCRYEFSEASPLPIEKAKQCLYYHTRECPAPCVGRISKDDYRKVAQAADDFFKGDFEHLLTQWANEMKDAAERRDYEKAAQLRDNLAAMGHMQERVTVRKVKLEDVEGRVDRSRAITDLQNALGLKRPPVRIECFDISHFQGTETVASMVVFINGEAKKDDYRKFRIRTVEGVDDFASMAEVVRRRYRRVLREERPMPDLILIDGGKGQLSASLAALKDVFKEFRAVAAEESSESTGSSADPKVRRIGTLQIAALAKQHEELFLPGQDLSVMLPQDSPASLLVRKVRDEAHRFAITFHRLRRDKKAFS